ncbi:MAG: transcriptional regulator [Acidobacteriota bacterium]|nr:MAG: transcriptional regulator [Acidobacteriota bacterium]
MSDSRSKSCYRIADFIVSPSRRLLLHEGREVALIPRYFDLLVLLIERRDEALSRREILDTVWSDVIVSDGALSQAIRTLRRALGDDSRGQKFIRTVPRYGYQFVHAGVLVVAEESLSSGATEETLARDAPERDRVEDDDPFEPLLMQLERPSPGDASRAETSRRDAAEKLHALGTEQALRRFEQRHGSPQARALLRDARWDVPGAGSVPILGKPRALATLLALVALRLQRALRLAGQRWMAAAVGGAGAGLLAGLVGGLVLRFGPGSSADSSVVFALVVVGTAVGGLGAAGVGAGLAAAEALIRSSRGLALTVFGAAGGGGIGALAHAIGQTLLRGLFGQDLSPLGGGLEGLLVGATAGLGYAIATPRAEGGMATPRGSRRLLVAAITGLCCAAGCVALASAGRYLGAMSLDFLAQSFPHSRVSLDPLARLLGEPQPGRWTAIVVSAWEGGMFGAGLALGLTHRPR